MPIASASDRLKETVDRLILKYSSTVEENKRLLSRVDELENRVEYQKGNADSEGYNLLRIHYARLLHERQELKQGLDALLEKLEKLRDQQRNSTND